MPGKVRAKSYRQRIVTNAIAGLQAKHSTTRLSLLVACHKTS
ncbi:MAG: hypothetical protein ACXU9I_01470 [Syntrophales bacterium]